MLQGAPGQKRSTMYQYVILTMMEKEMEGQLQLVVQLYQIEMMFKSGANRQQPFWLRPGSLAASFQQ